VLELRAYDLRVNNVEIDRSLSPSLPKVLVDRHQFQQVFLNLITNAEHAIRETGRRGAIRITTGVEDGAVRVIVADNGPGIAPENVRKVFLPFFTTKEVGRGSGLGLAQVYGFILQSNGQVSIDSEPGGGTTVSLVFPRSMNAPEAEEPPARTTIAHAERHSRARGNVLLVEDDATVAALTGQMLETIGLEVTHAKSAAEALDTLQAAQDVDVVYSDVMMPGGMSGVELAREIRRHWPDLPVVLTTGYIEAARAAVTEGLEVLVKPYSLDVLDDTLRAHLARRITLAR
jgi:CheY-like chemotaxis protein